MTDLPKYEGPRLVSLMDGTLVFDDSEAYRAECEARDIARKPQWERDAWLADIQQIRGEDAAARLRKMIEEVIAVEAGRPR
jgi:hypothetical protein